MKTWWVYLEDVHGDILDQTEVEAYTQVEAEELGDTVFKESDFSEGYPEGYAVKAYLCQGEVEASIDYALKQYVLDWAADQGIVLADSKLESMMNGIRYWFDTAISEVIDTAYSTLEEVESE